MAVMIGVDPHKASHTAVAISAAEEPLGEVRVRACAAQAEQLLAWAAAWPQRTWAVEGAGGLGHLLAQQLLAAGERVLDVPPKLGTRVRLLAAGDTNKNDPSAVSSARLKIHRGELTASTRLWPGNVGGFIGRVARLCWSLAGGLFDLVVEEVLGDGRVSAGGGV